MRALALSLLLVLACTEHGKGGGGDDTTSNVCPSTLTDGAVCAFTAPCLRENDFSSCASDMCRCTNGRIACAPIAPETGGTCVDVPLASCSFEGNPGCNAVPTSEFCSCNGTTWSCECACYGGQSTCGALCDAPPEVLAGKLCGEEHGVCNFAGGVTCRCERASPSEEPTFSCLQP